MHKSFWLVVTVLLTCGGTLPLLAQEEDFSYPAPVQEEEADTPAPSFAEDEEAFPTAARRERLHEESLSPESDEAEPNVGTPGAATLPASPSALQTSSWPIEPLPEAIPLPPFMTRPLEWEETPPAVIGMPALPSASAFSERDLAAFKFVEDGKENFDREDWALAREQFERAVSLAPLLPYSYYFLGRIAFVRGEFAHALAFLQKAELLFPRTDVDWLCEIATVKGTVYEDLQDYTQARTAYRRSLQFQPANLKVLSALARLPEQDSFLNDAVPQ
ncbi:MAG: tetratricopeptide repeat protein [Deltaproteobacteria bacterium]|nr:tetratricopeptide repeat protein [Deltaproteobacteria bacterium]